MDWNVLMQMVSTLGFPIVCCGFLGWYIVRTTDAHKAESDKMTEAIHNNTMVIQKLVDKLEDISNDK